jgi:predicted nucleotidyltransferase
MSIESIVVKLSKRELDALIEELAAVNLQWSEIYLFGSTAKGYAGPHSDRDFCVVIPKKPRNLHQIDIKLNKTLGLKGFNFDIVTTTTREFKKNKISPILHEIRTTGMKVA